MNILDFAIIAILGLFVLGGLYKGFMHTVIDIVCYMICALFAFLMTPIVSFNVVQNESVFNTMLYYTEGSENIYDVEYKKKNIAEISNAELEDIYSHSSVAFPMDERIRSNVSDAAFQSSNIYSLGDYFNQTIVDVVINIVSLLVLFIVIRLVLGWILRVVDFSMEGLPVMSRYDAAFSCGIGFLHGVLLLYIVFLLTPVVLTVVAPLEKYLYESVLGGFFYRVDPLLWLIPTT